MNPEENHNVEEKSPKPPRKWLTWLICLICTIVFGFSLGAALFFVTEKENGHGEPTFMLADNGYSGNSFQKLLSVVQDNAVIAETSAKVQSSVITIVVDVVENGIYGQGIGSGVIYQQEGDYLYVITNTHVVENAQSINMYTQNDEFYELTLIGSDAESDIAVVALDTTQLSAEQLSSLTVAEMGDSDAIRSGDIAIAVGSPYDLAYFNSVTVGVISYPKRELTISTTPSTYIQTDAAINPGNSGGALFNEQGQVIGINSSKIALEDVEGIGFAIPINRALEVANSLYSTGSIQSLLLGGIEDCTFLSDSLAALYHVPSGLVVYSVRPGSSGADAGLRSGDIITALDGVELTTLEQYNELLLSYSEGDVVTVTVVRGRNADEPLTMQLQMEAADVSESEQGGFWGTPN
ncbi:MAG: trypsin-like peptidase domain-containing protein [Firmicutes bacterium]|nr:trypsin-like peptidase domain-containing protein [Bacillota bacterium]